MVDHSALLQQQFQDKVEALNWEECCEQTNLGGLEGMAYLLLDEIKCNKVRQVVFITPLLKNKPLSELQISIEVGAVLSYNKCGPKKIASLQSAFLRALF